jgi:uncharacterized membrane protein
MSIEAYLAQLAGLLTLAPATRAEILQEVRDHLEDAAHHYIASGMARAQAEEQAVATFGDPVEVAPCGSMPSTRFNGTCGALL